MKKLEINNIFGDTIMTRAEEYVKDQKRGKFKYAKGISFLFVIMAFISLGISNYALSTIAFLASSLINLSKPSIFRTGFWRRLYIRDIMWMAGAYKDITNFDTNATVEIVPRNIKIGEDLEGVDAIPIFKEGKYVIIKSYMHPMFIRVFEEEGKTENYLMEVTEEDIETLREDVPEFEEYIKSLELRRKDSNLF